jgi:hypothetical protein
VPCKALELWDVSTTFAGKNHDFCHSSKPFLPEMVLWSALAIPGAAYITTLLACPEYVNAIHVGNVLGEPRKKRFPPRGQARSPGVPLLLVVVQIQHAVDGSTVEQPGFGMLQELVQAFVDVGWPEYGWPSGSRLCHLGT